MKNKEKNKESGILNACTGTVYTEVQKRDLKEDTVIGTGE